MTRLIQKLLSSKVETTNTPPPFRSPRYYAWRRFVANRAAVVSGVVLLFIIAVTIFAPLITLAKYDEQKFLADRLAFPSATHWFGIDDLGRDFLSRVVYGARVSLGIGFAAALCSVLIGLPLGALAGYYGGWLDWLVLRMIELFTVVPPLLAGLLLATLTRGGFIVIIIVAALHGWMQVCLLVRGQVKAFRDKEFIRAAQALGADPRYIILRHVIPNSVSPIIVGFVLAIPVAMILEASMSFLGIGVQPPTPSWGQMINTGMHFMFFYWHMAVFPTLALAVTVLATATFGDGLRDALDPTLQGQ